jgi:hypothetical protein
MGNRTHGIVRFDERVVDSDLAELCGAKARRELETKTSGLFNSAAVLSGQRTAECC